MNDWENMAFRENAAGKTPSGKRLKINFRSGYCFGIDKIIYIKENIKEGGEAYGMDMVGRFCGVPAR